VTGKGSKKGGILNQAQKATTPRRNPWTKKLESDVLTKSGGKNAQRGKESKRTTSCVLKGGGKAEEQVSGGERGGKSSFSQRVSRTPYT